MSQSFAPALEPGASAAAHDDLLYRKVSMRIIPFLFLCYVVSFLDRINIGFAQLQMKHDLGFSDAMYGLGAAVFYIGYVLCEVPSNMLLARFGARRTFTRIMLLWGIASVGMMMVSKPTHFYVLRFMLGVFEAGFFPGIVLYLTYWYPARRRAAVLSIFFAGVAVAGVLGGLVSGWIMRDMGGVMGLFGWQWMFVIEGAPAIVLGSARRVLSGGRAAARDMAHAAEKAQLIAQRDEDRRVSSDAHSSRSVMQALRNPRVYLFAFIYFSLTCASLTLNFWMPLMIRDFGVHDVLAISLYTVIPNAIGAVGPDPDCAPFGSARRAAPALCGLHDWRRHRAVAADAASEQLPRDARDSLARRRADLRRVADLLDCAVGLSVRRGGGGRYCADQQHRHYERHCQPVGDRSDQDAHGQHGQRAVSADRAAVR